MINSEVMTNNRMREEAIKGSSDRVFGLMFAVIFLGIGLWPLFYGMPLRNWALVLGAAFFALSILRPHTLSWLNRTWMRFGLLLNRIVSPIAVGVVYFLGVFPMAMLMRAFGKRPLKLEREPDAKSYWIFRKPPGPDPKTMSDQF
jgi:hypothetical protein